jgi:hypothetical protein
MELTWDDRYQETQPRVHLPIGQEHNFTVTPGQPGSASPSPRVSQVALHPHPGLGQVALHPHPGLGQVALHLVTVASR